MYANRYESVLMRGKRNPLVLMVPVLLVLGSLLGATPVSAQQDTRVTMDFKDVEIQDLVQTMAKLTGRNFMLDERVRGRVTIISPSPLTVEEAYRVFLGALEFRNLTVVPSGKVLKIVPLQNAIRNPAPLSRDGTDREMFITRIVRLDFVDAEEVSNLLKNFNSTYGQIIAYKPTNMLIIGDVGPQVNRMLQVISEIDVPGHEQTMGFVQLEYAEPDEVAAIINEIYSSGQQAPAAPRRGRRGQQAQASSGGQVKVIAVARLNSLIILASQSEIDAIRDLVQRLDEEPEVMTGGGVHVHNLKYADAEQMAATLGGFTQAGAGGAGAGDQRARRQRQQQQDGGGQSTPMTAEFDDGVRITPDKPTNSLLIVASPGDYQRLKRLIDQLDVPRKQVYVEAVIMEVSLDKVRDYGLSWHTGSEIGQDGVAFGGQALGGVSTLTMGAQPPALPGMFLGALARPIDIGGMTVFGLGALLRALQTDESVNILSTPNILTTDNEDAEIVVGQNVPFITGQTATTGGNVLTSIERQDVGITLRITPQINADNQVRMRIEQETSSVQAAAPQGLNVNQQGLITRKRSARTTVVANDRQTIVLGGLMSDEIDRSQTKIPILGDLPILGWLFKSSQSTNRKTNLLIFLTPYVIETADDMETYTNKREEYFHQHREESNIDALDDRYTFRRTYGRWADDADFDRDRLDEEGEAGRVQAPLPGVIQHEEEVEEEPLGVPPAEPDALDAEPALPEVPDESGDPDVHLPDEARDEPQTDLELSGDGIEPTDDAVGDEQVDQLIAE